LVLGLDELRLSNLAAAEFEHPADLGLLQNHVGPLDGLPYRGVFDGIAPKVFLEGVLPGPAAIPEVAERPPHLGLKVVGRSAPDEAETELVKAVVVHNLGIVHSRRTEELLIDPVQEGVDGPDEFGVVAA
jgi:hypothetical protein